MTKNLKEWAISLSGCDGGNPNADIWVCGIEWGGGSMGRYYEKDLPEEISKGRVELDDNIYRWKDSLTYTYGRNLAKLYMAITGKKVEQYKDVQNLEGTEIFKTNLYPIAFDSTNPALWHQYQLDKITGFENKRLFNTWCFFNRFPEFRRLRKEYKPKVIICTGVDYLRDFLMFFASSETLEKIEVGELPIESKTNSHLRQYYTIMIEESTFLVVIPFFSGSYGLNSNNLLQKMGNIIHNYYE